jgi:hypothetical protein
MLKPNQVIAKFGEALRAAISHGLILYDVGRHAVVFAKHFELWESKIVVEWTRAMIREGRERRNGFTRKSLQTLHDCRGRRPNTCAVSAEAGPGDGVGSACPALADPARGLDG